MHSDWELTILDADPVSRELCSVAAGDIDKDGNVELVIGDCSDLHWYRPATRERGILPNVESHVGIALEDVDGDGRLEAVLGDNAGHGLYWYKPGSDLHKPWERYTIDPDTGGGAHDVVFGDIDGDGEDELICGEHDPFWSYRSMCSLYVYKRADPAGLAWRRYCLDSRFEHHDGTKIIDLGGGRKGIVSHGWTDSIYVNLWEPPRAVQGSTR